MYCVPVFVLTCILILIVLIMLYTCIIAYFNISIMEEINIYHIIKISEPATNMSTYLKV